MKCFKAAAQRVTAFVLAAGMISSAVLPTVFAAQPLNTENSVDELGNIDLSDETYNVPEEDAETSAPEESEEVTDEDAGADGDIVIAVPDQPEWLPENEDIALYWKPHKGDCSRDILLEEHAATCTTAHTKKWKCTKNAHFENWWETIGAPLGHMPEENAKTYTQQATCTKNGVTYKYCGRNNNGTICTYEYGGTRQTIYAKGHLSSTGEYWFPNDEATQNEGWQTVDATCGEAGKRYRDCVNCSEADGYEEDPSYAENHPATGDHTPFVDLTSADSWHVLTEATCTEEGERIQKCAVCGQDIPGTEEAIPELGHTYDETVAALKPCESGTFTCTRCGDEKTVTATEEHQFTDWAVTKEPSCEGYGERQRTCTVCGTVDTDTTEGEEIQPIGHDWGDWVDDDKPACQQQTATRRCKREGCSSSEQKNLPNFGADGNPKPHKFTRWDTKVVWNGIVPKEITYASCDYCGYKEERENNTSLTVNTQAAKVAADELKSTVRKIVDETLKDVQNNVNAAQTKEEATTAIANLEDSLAKAMADKIYMDVGGTKVGITEEQAKKILDEAMPELSGIKDSLDKSFLSKESIQAAVNKIVDSVTSPAGDAAIEDAAYELLYKLAYDALAGGKSDYAEPIEVLVGKLASIIAEDDTGWDALTEAIVDDAVALAMEELRNDEEYSRYLKTQLGADAIADVEAMIKEQLVNDPTFMNEVRGYVQKAAGHAATGASKGWSNEKILSNIRTDLSPVSSLVAKKISELGAGAGDIVDDKVDDTVHKFLPGKLGDWLSDKLGGLAQGKVNNAVDKAGTKVTNTIDSYLKYITCGSHDRRDRVIRNASCTQTEVTENYCTKCGWVFDKTDSSPALGHDPVTVEGRDATETADGLTDGVRCARCGEWLEPQEVIPALEPQLDKWLVKADITADTVKAAGYKDQKALDAAIDAALKDAGFDPAGSERFFAQVNSSIGILPNDRYPEDGVTGMVKIPAGAEGKNCAYYAVQVLTADTSGYNAGDVVITPLTVTKEGLAFRVPVQSVVAIAWKVNE